jgi:hypothetical protein
MTLADWLIFLATLVGVAWVLTAAWERFLSWVLDEDSEGENDGE